MKSAKVVVTAIFLFTLFPGGFQVASAAFNTEINYQGKLTDTSDNAVADGDYNFKFQLCTDSACASSVWSETRETTNKVTVTNGIFSVLLGEVTSIASVDFNDELWLEVQVGGTGSSPSYETLTPRKKLGAVPAAFEADKLDGLDSTAFLRASNDLSDLNSSSTARTNLGLVIGTDVQAWDTDLDTIAGLAKTTGNLIVGSSTEWAALSVGADGRVLTASSTAAGGLSWEAASATALDEIGDPTASSTIEIGSTVLTIDSSAASSTFVLDGLNGRIGIGVTSPASTLDVLGGATFGSSTASVLVIPDIVGITGSGNSIAGSGAGAALTSGTNNTLFGLNAGNAITTANNNTAVGYAALDVNTTGASNVAIGTGALGGNTTASNNTALGYQAGDVITTGAGNIILGSGADPSSATANNEFVAGSANAAITNVYFGEGPLDGTPLAYTINGTGGSGTDIAGAALQLAGGRGTGTGAGGSILFQTSAASSTGSTLNILETRMTIDSDGNVGIGTTSPSSTLHVAGQCVTGDTRLRRRRKRGKEYIYDEVEIKDIQPGDEILSMEADGKFTWSKVNALMDMGRQEIYKLVTNKGKIIRTTGNHPYFVLEKRPAATLKQLYSTFEVDQSHRLEDMSVDSVIALASKETGQVVTVKISKKLKVKIARASYSGKRKMFGPEMLSVLILYAIWSRGLKVGRLVIDNEYPGCENTIADFIRRAYPEMAISFRSIGRQVMAHKAAWARATNKKTPQRDVLLKAMVSLDFEESLTAELIHPGLVTGGSQPTQPFVPIVYQSPLQLSRGEMAEAKWTKAQYLRAGMQVATVEGWEVVAAIYKTGAKEQTYDIEIENTHNFVGNDIVAHNTFIDGSADETQLHVQGNSTQTSSLVVFEDSSGTDLLTVDARTTNSGTSAFTLVGLAPTIASAAGAEYTTLTVTPPTITLTGTTQVTSQMDSVLVSAPTITDASAITVDDAATLTIAGAPVGEGFVTLTDAYGLKINAGATSSSTRAYGLYVDAPTGATTNYGAAFASGNVGIGTTSPTDKLTIRSDSAGATVDLLRLENLGTATVSSALGINLYANRTTGGSTNFAGIDGTITSIDNTNYAGKLDFNIAQNGSLTTLLTIGDPNVEINAPLVVDVGGDVGIDYDLQFLNTGTSYITSEGPLRIEAGDPNHAENLTLGTQGTGDVVVDVNDASLSGGGFKVLGAPGLVLHVNPGGAIMMGGAQATLEVNDATPNVASGTSYITANTASTTITDFLGPGDASATLEAGQLLFIEINDGNTTFDCAPGTDIDCGAADIVGEGGDMTMWFYDGTDWKLVSYMQNLATQTGADIAEFFESQQGLEAGDLVALDTAVPVNVRKTTRSYDTRMIGVVSTEPGITLGQEATSTYPIALAGRVPVKVSLENGPIQVGDLLTSSGEEGVAMKATGMGRTIGYALEPANEDGKILVFVDPSWSPGSFDLNGLLAGVSATSTASSTQTTAGNPAQAFLAAVRGALESFTGTIKTAGNWIFEKITAKIVRVEKIEIADQATGTIYCTWIENGEWVKAQGECDAEKSEAPSTKSETNSNTQNSNDQNSTPPPPAPSPEPEAESEPEEKPEESSEGETASSTPAAEEEIDGETSDVEEEQSDGKTSDVEEEAEEPAEEEPQEQAEEKEVPVEESQPEEEPEPDPTSAPEAAQEPIQE